MSYELPLDKYSGSHLVMWGNRLVLNTNVLLVRTSNWSREFFEKIVSTIENVTNGDVNAAFMRQFESNMHVVSDRVYFEYAHLINWHWINPIATWMVSFWRPFIVDFEKCDLCENIECDKKFSCWFAWQTYVKYSNIYYIKALKSNRTSENFF